MLLTVLVGFLFGVLGSIHVAGPVGILVFTRAVQSRYRSGLFIAIGGAIAESIYAFLAFWGFGTLLESYPLITPVADGIAAVLLVLMGIILIVRREVHAATEGPPPADSDIGSFLIGFSVAAFNPTIVAGWTAAATVVLASGIIRPTGSMSIPFAAAAAAGILAAFIAVIKLVQRYKRSFNQKTLDRFIVVMGALMIGLGVWFGSKLASYLLTA